MNLKEIINEVFVLTSCNLLVLFTDFCPDIMTQYVIGGWAYMAVVGLCIIFNLVFVFAEPFRLLKLRIIKMYRICKYRSKLYRLRRE